MKVRRIHIEIEVPFSIHARAVLEVVRVALNAARFSHQEQILYDEESTNTRIGDQE